MKRQVLAALAAIAAATLAGCGGGGSGTTTAASTTVSGTVADGYLANAQVFLDKNGNYQLDPGEPNAMTTTGGKYTMTVTAGDQTKYPMVVRAIAGTTTDQDSGTVGQGYVMTAPAGIAGFISPMSTLIEEKMAANPGMTLTDAMVQLRNQLNLPATMSMLGDYVAGGSQAGTNQTNYQFMHQLAQQMVTLMQSQAGTVMGSGGSGTVYAGRYRAMMGTINQNLPQLANNVTTGAGTGSTFMTTMRTQMQAMLGSMPMTAGFGNYSSLFRNMTSHSYFWNYSGNSWQPHNGMGGGMGMM
ncbi:lipoprotein [Geotalea uraniireducens]|uniref:Lipoprotein n=1 Tax=Geotalea uraniireducens TaxID=351604 RepID=A0ABN6VPF3_9BACT|nr:hypothetical protein [Geotalea uraniireducens]BDV41152.1 lipoprotein [Geotalea uraniireducens]